MTRITHEGKVLALLSDGKPHSHHEIYALYVIGHSRIAGLKDKGFGIEHWQEGQTHWYQLVSRPLEAPSGSPSSRVDGTDGASSGSGLGVLPDNDRVDTNVQSPAPLDNLCRESTGAPPPEAECASGAGLFTGSADDSHGAVAQWTEQGRPTPTVEGSTPSRLAWTEPNGSETRSFPMSPVPVEAVTSPTTVGSDHRSDPSPVGAASVHLAVLPGGQLTLRWAA